MISSRLKWICSIVLFFVFSFYSQVVYAQNVDAADLGASNEFIYKLNTQRVYGMRVSATLGDATLTQLTSQATTGTYAAGDILNFSLYYNNVNDFSSATLISTSLNSNGSGEIVDFNSFSQIIPGNGADRYLFIAANVRTTAVTGRTFGFSFFAAGNFSWTTAVNVSASLGGSGKKTIQPDDFVTTWNTTNSGIGNDRIFLNMLGAGLSYTVSYQDVNNAGVFGTFPTRNSPFTFVFPSPGTYQIIITGTYSQIINGGNLDAPKLLSVDHWGSRAWSSMDGAFSQCSNLHIKATDAPNLTVATSLHQMFASASSMNEDISQWDVSHITDMSEVFSLASSFDQDISLWDVSNVTNMDKMFTFATSFNQPVNTWDVSNVTNMQGMFRGTDAFNQSLNNWDVSNVTNFNNMFSRTASFNQSLNAWDLSSADQMYNMFDEALAFNGDISNWDVSSATNMAFMFSNTAAFNVDISGWNIGNVTYAPGMFNNATAFNRDINSWNITGLNDLTNMFAGATAFNQPLNNWDVSNVSTMNGMFAQATAFNQSIAGWNTGNVTDLSYMFQGANSFNQNIRSWNVSNVTLMNHTFESNTAFNQNLSSWDVHNVTNMAQIFSGSALSPGNYDNILIGWAALSGLQSDVSLGADGITYCAGEGARNTLTSSPHNWLITDAGKSCGAFITTWKTTNTGTTASNEIMISTYTSVTYNYDIYWQQVGSPAVNGTVTGLTGDHILTFPSSGTYEVHITGLFPGIFFGNTGDKNKIISIDQWGSNSWEYMGQAFFGCSNLGYNASDTPDLSGVNSFYRTFSSSSFNGNINNWDVSTIVDMSYMFQNASSFNQSLNSWDVSNVTNMNYMFANASVFNGDLSSWDVGSVTTMQAMFTFCPVFNQDIGNWNVSNVTLMNDMFSLATVFNQNLNNWDVSNVTSMARMFQHAHQFNQPLNNWDVSNVTDMNVMFSSANVFNQPLNNWSVTNVTNMFSMFANSAFNQNITGWDLSNVTSTGSMFDGASSFNQNISGWNVGNVQNMNQMFRNASSFNQNLASWDVQQVTGMSEMFNGSGLSNTNYDNILIGWAALSGLEDDVSLDASGKTYCAGESARTLLIAVHGWIINDGGKFCAALPAIPSITSFTPTSGVPGTAVTITGTNFNPSAPNDVYFGAVKVTANADATGTSITVNVPAGATSVTPISVRNNSNNLQASSLNSSTPYFTVTTNLVLDLTPANYVRTDYPASNPASVVAADFDNDGYVDLAVPDRVFKNISLLKNDGSGSFTYPWGALVPSVNIFNLKAADINGDGNADLIGASTTNTQLTLFLGNGNGTFTHLSDINGVTGNGAGLSIADVDNDGAPDLITSYGANQLAVLKGDGSGNFAATTGSPYTIAGANSPGELVTADFNNDTYVDIAVTNVNASNIYILLNNQDGTFATPVSVTTGTSPFQIVAGKFDGDSNIDLAVLTYGSSNMTILKGNGNGGFSPFAGSPVAIGGTPLGLYNGDFDGDGFTDLIVGGNNQNNIGFFKGNGSGGFASFPSFPYTVGTSVYGLITADFNNDGKADIAAANDGNNTLSVLLYHSEAFITTWSTTDNKIVIPHGSGSFNYDITWTNLTTAGAGDGSATVVDGPFSTYTISGLNNTDVYQVEITGTFPHLRSMDIFSPTPEPLKLRSIENWGNIAWQSMNSAFAGCTNLIYNATDKPNLTNVTDMSYMFYECHQFNGNVDSWDVSNVTNMSYLFFQNQVFNQDLNSWDVSNVTDMSSMFQRNFVFNGYISNWDVGNITTSAAMFDGCALFDRDISGWDVSNLVNMQSMFSGCQSFNQNLNNWDVSNVTNMSFAFTGAQAFNSPLSNWDVSNVTNMRNLFDASGFNNPIGNWDVSNVTNMAGMLAQGPFNQDISSWDVANVNDMSSMFFNNTDFNRSLSSWDVGSVTNTGSMFLGASSFNQNLSAWDVISITNMSNMFDGSGLSNVNYDNVLIGWGAQSVQNNVTLGALGKKYCAGESARAALIASHGWTIIDAGPCAPTIALFTPTTGMSGTTVVITGTKFTGATVVRFGGINATSFTVDSPTQITATVANGSSGNVAVTGPGGTGSLGGFIFIGVPSISSFTPASAGTGTTVTITGTNFDGTTSVTFGGTTATSFTVVSTTTITAVVGSGTSGNVVVTNPAGSDTKSGFIFVPAPTITSFTPGTAAAASTITITGTNFTGTTSVSFGGTPATSFTVDSPTQITATVANGSSGTVEVATVGGTTTSSGSFTFIPSPTITSFAPTSAIAGTTVTITGTNFTGATAVTFGGTSSTSFTVVSATSITAVVGNGTSGDVEIITPGGTSSLSGFTFIAAPTITSFTPASATTGETVTITGTNFNGTTSVTFGGTAATSFTVVSSTTITAVIGNGTSGSIAVTTPGGTIAQAGFTLVPPTVPSIPIVKDGDNNSGNPVTSQPGDAIDLGQTYVGKDITKTFSIENTSAVPIQVMSVTLDNNNFAIDEQPASIPANSFARLVLKLKAEQIGIYSARVAIQYQTGSFEFTVTGEVKDPAIIVYNAVTPNGDGNHDFLKIFNIELYPENRVTIINRLGEPVFKISNYTNSDATKRFNGQGNTGGTESLTDGTYYYIIDIGTKDNYTGFLLLQK